MKLILTIWISVFTICNAIGQRNCNVYQWEGDSCRYQACSYLEEAPRFFQLKKEFHEIFDKAVEICPEYSDAYRGKSVAYLKTGDFVTWKKLMDKAVEFDPKTHLGYRGWCKFQFLRDYQGAITDIELLEELSNGNIGYSQNGMYHLIIAKALCYKMLGQPNIAVRLIENKLNEEGYIAGQYDNLHLGVLRLEIGKYQEALNAFEKQEKEHDCAENSYYRAITYGAMEDFGKQSEYLIHAKALYLKTMTMHDTYTHPIDKVFLETIENAS